MLTPDRPLAADALRDLGLVALFDALASLAPPQVPLQVTGADELSVDGARAASVRTEQAPGDWPDWAVIGIDVAVGALGDDPGLYPGETSLAEEGFGDVTAAEILALTCRHLLVWIDAWQEDGAALLARAVRDRQATVRA